MDDERKANRNIAMGMVIVALCGIIMGCSIGYIASKAYLNNKILKTMTADGYVLTGDATAGPNDIIEGKNAYVNGKLVVGEKTVFDSSDATATADKILKGKKAFVNGKLITGTLETIAGKEVVPGADAVSFGPGYLSSDIVILGDSNLVPENIKQGVTIFHITGTCIRKASAAD